MNEKIKELATQAHIFANQQTGDQFVALDVFKEKFAELIIQECAKVCKTGAVSNIDYNTGRLHCYSDIINHFGVK